MNQLIVLSLLCSRYAIKIIKGVSRRTIKQGFDLEVENFNKPKEAVGGEESGKTSFRGEGFQKYIVFRD